MGRKPTKNLNLPAGMRARVRPYGTYYYLDLGKQADGTRKEVPLGRDYVAAVRKWGELTTSDTPKAAQITFRHAAERYLKDVLPTKAPETQSGNLRELRKLYEFFDDGPLDEIEPVHIRQYLDWRVQSTVAAKVAENVQRKKDGKEPLPVAKDEGSVRANREKALFSHIWNFARGAGLTSKANPCAGIKGYKETGRDVYIEDEIYRLVHDVAEEPLKDAMDLAYLIGQRPADVLKLTRADVREGALLVKQGKTGAKVRIAIEGELAALLERIGNRKVTGLKLINMPDGTPMTKPMLRHALDRARAVASGDRPELKARIWEFQFRDLRAKAATDKDEAEGGAAAQELLGHTTPTMTRQYVRHRKGKLVKPTK